METFATNQNNFLPVQVTNENLQMQAPSHALVTTIELKNGKIVPIITMFNDSQIDFEEVNIGVNTMIKRNSFLNGLMKSKQNVLYKNNNGVLRRGIVFFKEIFE
ncbi:MAG: hypothetical protein IE891_05615 [Flavobacteriaceae bacterium]|nr:hypothetical protein [Flavobacteriaceae bacterium]